MKTKVLFVEDEERGVFPYFHALEKIGFECTLVKDGDEVINKLRQEKFDLISIDITFPPGNLLGDKVEPTKAGLKLLEMIRNGRIPNCDPAIKVIVLTAMNDKITENKVKVPK